MIDNEVTEKIKELTDTVEKLEEEFNKIKENQNPPNEVESKKVNLLEDVKKAKYSIKQVKAQLSVRNEKEKVILDELNLLSDQFQTDIDEDTGIATVYLSLSLESHFSIDIDCSNYPEPPFLFIPQDIIDFFDGNLLSELRCLKKWSVKKPPHLVDIMKELEGKMVKIFQVEDGVIEDREKMAQRRKLIGFARKAEEDGNKEEAINLYRAVLKISHELKDTKTYLKYKQRIQEIDSTGG